MSFLLLLLIFVPGQVFSEQQESLIPVAQEITAEEQSPVADFRVVELAEEAGEILREESEELDEGRYDETLLELYQELIDGGMDLEDARREIAAIDSIFLGEVPRLYAPNLENMLHLEKGSYDYGFQEFLEKFPAARAYYPDAYKEKSDKSTPGLWSRLPLEHAPGRIYALALHPENTNEIYAIPDGPGGSDQAEGIFLREVLRVKVGTSVFLGFVDGPRARAKVVALGTDGSVDLEVIDRELAPEVLPITLLIGLPRPHTAKRILFEAASLGVASLHFFESERSEPFYAQSSLWKTQEWRDRVRLGAEQAFTTHLLDVAMHADLQSAITALHGADVHVALDNYEACGSLDQAYGGIAASSAVIAIGSERGWSPNERDVFRKNGWKLAHLGAHVLRVETACVAAVSATAATLGLWTEQTMTTL